MKNWLQIDLFQWNWIDKNWWGIHILRIEGKNWSWTLFSMEEDLEDCSVQWFQFNLHK